MNTPLKLDDINDQCVVPLANIGIIAMTGEQNITFLDGQVTSSVKSLDAEHASYTCHCDAKGKMHGIFRLFHCDDAILLLGHADSVNQSLPEFKKYAVFSKVEIENVSDNWQVFGVVGEDAVAEFGVSKDQLPRSNHQLTYHQQMTIIRVSDCAPRFLICVPNSHPLPDLSAITEYSQAVWEALEVADGLPNVQTATAGEFVPQMMNMQALQAISFTKGCYMGQETVARTRYLGKNKRAAFILHSNTGINCHAGDSLEMALNDNWRRAGTVIRSATLESETWALAVLPKDIELDTPVRLKEQPEQVFNVKPVPYSITD
ncbi:tRNA-modifying protein YgfZ [Aestuariibacter salexigens]|uniref:tRNA-modifying protein YgfZ n=1 Tax=Aestuariibacter salexigens TaxID=226010 RepID=UPI00040C59FF|nr:tRNA-modifying protein YgfZ [Aestuariibacter salexigens]